VRQQPVLEVETLYHRDDYIYQVSLPGGAEHRVLMGLPQEPRMFRVVQNTVAGLRAVALTQGGAGWLHAVVAIDQRAAGQAKNAGLAALAAHPSLKRVVVVDGDIDVYDADDVEWAIATRVQPDRDVIVVPGAHGSSLDPTRDPVTETTATWIIDATRPMDGDPDLFVRVEPPLD
jgi:2,5-furandicarboxylate decarboxylase 1